MNERRSNTDGPRVAFQRLPDYDFFDADPIALEAARVYHERNRLPSIQLTPDEIVEAAANRRERNRLADMVHSNAIISEYLAECLGKMARDQNALIHRIRERVGIREIDITLDQDYNVIEAAGTIPVDK